MYEFLDALRSPVPTGGWTIDPQIVTTLFADHLPIVGFTKQQWWEESRLHLGLLAGSMAVFLTAVIGLPIAALRNRWRRRGARLTRGLGWLASLLFVAFPFCWPSA